MKRPLTPLSARIIADSVGMLRYDAGQISPLAWAASDKRPDAVECLRLALMHAEDVAARALQIRDRLRAATDRAIREGSRRETLAGSETRLIASEGNAGRTCGEEQPPTATANPATTESVASATAPAHGPEPIFLNPSALNHQPSR